MDELLAAVSTVNVAKQVNNVHAEHPRYAQYKQRDRLGQVVRRQRMLEAQKKQRFDFLMHVRQLASGDTAEDDEDMDCENCSKPQKPSRSYKNQIMLSEWLVDVPDDFHENWYMVPCPIGKRSLIIAAKGRTKSFAKSGMHICTFQSLLPGGSCETAHGKYTILDTIWSPTKNVFYVLDVMCWSGHPVYDCEASFRFYWLEAKLSEVNGIKRKHANNRYPFLTLPYVNCEGQEISSVMNSLDLGTELDGLLFYHKNTHYTHGSTPLVGWLKPYMIPEILHIDIPSFYMQSMPARYTNMKAHMDLAQRTARKSKKKSINDSEGMQVDGVCITEF